MSDHFMGFMLGIAVMLSAAFLKDGAWLLSAVTAAVAVGFYFVSRAEW